MKCCVFTVFLFVLIAGTAYPADPGSTPAKPWDMPNWVVTLFVGLVGAYFAVKFGTFQTREGCVAHQEKCHKDTLSEMKRDDSERKIRLELVAQELVHFTDAIKDLKDGPIADLKKTVDAQGEQLAKQAQVLVRIGARFGVDVKDLQ